MRAFREWLAFKIAPWVYIPYREDREEAFRDLAEVAYGSRNAIWTSPRTLVHVALEYSRAGSLKGDGDEMKAALTLKGGGQWPAQSKARRLGVDRLGWTTDDPQIDPALNGGIQVLEPVRANQFTLFLLRAFWDWGGTPEAWAAAFKADLKRLDLLATPQHPARQCALNADLEVDDSTWVLAALKELRKLMPGRGVTWSMQPHKGGIIGDPLRDFINQDQWVTVAPYLYRNNMDRCSERWVVQDLLDRGIKPAKIIPYYRDWAEGWNGFLWDLEQIV